MLFRVEKPQTFEFSIDYFINEKQWKIVFGFVTVAKEK